MAEAAIVSFNHLIGGKAEKTGDFGDLPWFERQAYLGAASAAPPAIKIFPLGVFQHKYTFSFLPYILSRHDFVFTLTRAQDIYNGLNTIDPG